MNQQKIKICFVASNIYFYFHSEKSGYYGGAELNFYLLAREFARLPSMKISCVAGDFGQEQIEIIDNISIFRGLALKDRHLFRGLISAFYYFWLFRKINADIYIQSGAGILTFETALYCRLFGKKFIYRLSHDRDATGEYVRKNGIFGKLFKWALYWASIIVAQSEFQERSLKQTFNFKSQIIKNVFSITHLREERERNLILWVARALPWKQPEIFLKLARDFPNEKFLMIMQKQNDDFRDSIRKEKKTIPNLEIIELVPPDKIGEYFLKAKIFVNTSLEEGFPNTFLQAANARTPILSFIVNPDNFLNLYHCGFSAEGNYGKLVLRFRELIENQALRDQLGKNAFLYLQKNHNILNVVKDWKGAINLCAKSKK